MTGNLIKEPNGCIKTGFDGYIKPYGIFVHGDLFRQGEVIYARVANASYAQPLKIHAIIYDYVSWFDRGSDIIPYSTIVARMDKCKLLDYEGTLVTRELLEKPT